MSARLHTIIEDDATVGLRCGIAGSAFNGTRNTLLLLLAAVRKSDSAPWVRWRRRGAVFGIRYRGGSGVGHRL